MAVGQTLSRRLKHRSDLLEFRRMGIGSSHYGGLVVTDSIIYFIALC